MEFLYLLQQWRTSFLYELMLVITQFGEETAFLVTAIIVFWCVDKYKGYYILSVGFLGTIANQFMKLLFRIPRPWVLDPAFPVAEAAKEAAGGYSFPSGHTQNAVGTFGAIAYTTKKTWIRVAAIVIAVLVAFSRMYLGVHTPLDVGVAFGMAVILVLALKPVVLGNCKRIFSWLLGIMLVIAAAFLLYVMCYPFPADIDQHNLYSGMKNACTLAGALVGLVIVYIVDEKWLKFSTDGVWWVQVLKVSAGLLLVLAVKSGLKAPLEFVFGEFTGRAVRYCLVVLTAGIVWPLSFQWFAKLGNKE